MHIRHKPGDKMVVDWAGQPLQLHNPETGTVSTAYIFVGTLPFSMYCFAESFPDMKEESWINANIHMVQFFGGVVRLLVTDNLKTGIVSNRKHEDSVANQAYQEFSLAITTPHACQPGCFRPKTRQLSRKMLAM